MGSRYLAWKKMKNKKNSVHYQVGSMAVAMVVGIVSEMAAANECNR